MLKVGMIEYINALPYVAAFQKNALSMDVDWLWGSPSSLNRSLNKGECDVALISSAEYLANQNVYTLLPHFCISAERQVLSVCLYTKSKIDELNGKSCALTSQSASSALLLKILFSHWNIKPIFTELKGFADHKKHDAFLLIGDECLRHPQVDGYETIDLASAWYKLTQLPFTFAVLAAKSTIYEVKKQAILELEKQLLRALDWADNHREEVERLAFAQSSLSKNLIRNYYTLLNYRIQEKERKGLEIFSLLSQPIGAF